MCITLGDTAIITASTDCHQSRMPCDLRPKSTTASFAGFKDSNAAKGTEAWPLICCVLCRYRLLQRADQPSDDSYCVVCLIVCDI